MEGSEEIFLRRIQFVETRQNTKSKLANSTCIIVPSLPVSVGQKHFWFSLDKLDSEPSFKYNSYKVHKIRVVELSEKDNWSRVSWKRIYKNQ